MIAAMLHQLFAASRISVPLARGVAYQAAVAGLSKEDLVRLITVLTEGAMHGPVAARSMAARVGEQAG